MKPSTKGLVLAGVHLAIVLSLAGKFLLDRATRPRAWLRAAPVDPDLPVRGRYVSLQVEVPLVRSQLPPAPSATEQTNQPWLARQGTPVRVRLEAGPGGLVAVREPAPPSYEKERWPSSVDGRIDPAVRQLPPGQWTVRLAAPLAFFIPEHVPDPSLRKPGEELWVEATLPAKGPLRPIRLAVKKDGQLVPLAF